MRELLLPARPIILRKRRSQRRKTRYDFSLGNYYGRWVSIDARLPGVLLPESIENRDLPEFAQYSFLKREITYRSSRIDLLLGKGKDRCLVETKCITLVNGEVALFPDVPTITGTKHVVDLIEAIAEAYETWIIFICRRDDARFLSPNESADPHFTETLRRAYNWG